MLVLTITVAGSHVSFPCVLVDAHVICIVMSQTAVSVASQAGMHLTMCLHRFVRLTHQC